MWKLPGIGHQLTLDFLNPLIPLNKISSDIVSIIKSNLTKYNLSHQIISDNIIKINNINEDKSVSGETLIVTIINGYVSLSTHIKENMISLEVKLNNSNTEKGESEIYNFEIMFNSLFGWKNSTGNISFSRGGNYYHLVNKYYHSETMYKNVKLIHWEKTKYQDLRIYDSLDMGRMLSLDYMIQNSDVSTEDNYTVDLSSLILKNNNVDENTVFNHILIIGAGDMIIPDYILRTFNNVKKLTMVEIDDRVIENTKQYFNKFYQNIDKYVKDGRLEIIVDDGAKFLKENATGNKVLYDGILIDNSDVYLFDGPAANLFTKEFYKNIYNSLNKNAFFCQQVSDEQVKNKWTEMVKSVGFETIIYKYSNMPEYSTSLPLGSAMKN